MYKETTIDKIINFICDNTKIIFIIGTIILVTLIMIIIINEIVYKIKFKKKIRKLDLILESKNWEDWYKD